MWNTIKKITVPLHHYPDLKEQAVSSPEYRKSQIQSYYICSARARTKRIGIFYQVL